MRAAVYRTDPCLARIVDRENRAWDPLLFNGGYRYVVGTAFRSWRSYGLPQAQPGWKMAAAGVDWRTNPWTQLRWMRGYVRGRYGGSCGAWAFWQRSRWY